MLGAVGAFAAMAVATREIAHRYDTFEILAYRSVIGFVVLAAIATIWRRWHQVSTAHLPRHVLRNICHFTGQALWFWALTVIPLAQVFALEFTSPIWVLLLSPLFVGERLTAPKLALSALGFAGVLLVARPDFRALDPGLLAAAACAIFFALSVLITKTLTRVEPVLSILVWLTVMQGVIGVGLSLARGGLMPPDGATAGWLILVGLAGLWAHLCLTRALSLAPASLVVPVDFARLPVIAVIGAAAYAEPIDALVLAGGAVIFLANWLNLRLDARGAKATAPTHVSVTPRH
jgi:drug/metabolite transporter (DMT)-like permease